ncbi:MAG: class B sortase [Clostridiales bacterium]|jgi:sortase B|nr:class B sortase [Clostridiales bacterium]
MLRKIMVFGILVAMGFSVYQICRIDGQYADEEKTHDSLLAYKPPLLTAAPDAAPSPLVDYSKIFQAVIDAQTNLNADIVGWLTIPGTDVDYPFLQSSDNAFYLDRDPYKNKAVAGSIFMDFRNKKKIQDFNTILYGHHMKNGSMFGALLNFTNEVFFQSFSRGELVLNDCVYELEFFASLLISGGNEEIYGTINPPTTQRDAFLRYVKDTAKVYRELNVNASDKIISLSTCAYDFKNARLVVLARAQKISV